jgi:hypothetical protein
MARAPAVIKQPKTNLPATIEEEMAAEIAALQSRLAAPSGDMISCAGKVFALPDGQKSSDPLRVIIVDFITMNAYYDRKYDPQNPTPPACFALGLEPTKMVQSVNSPDNQNPEGDCSSCWAGQWGSDGKGKACGNARLLAVLPAIEDLSDDTPMWLIKVSATALKGFDGYVASVARAFNRPVRGVSTLIDFNPNTDYPQLIFGSPEPISKEHLLIAHGRRGEAMKRLMTEPDVSGWEPVVAKAAPKGKAPARAAAGGRR